LADPRAAAGIGLNKTLPPAAEKAPPFSLEGASRPPLSILAAGGEHSRIARPRPIAASMTNMGCSNRKAG
jgi:hypothetical protein